MQVLRFCSLFIAGIHLFLPAVAQNRDSERKLSATDTLITLSRKNTSAVKRSFHFKYVIIPAVMIAYGVTALKTDALQDWNEELKDDIWTEAPPHKQLHLDNYLQWAPAVAVYGLNVAGIKGEHNFTDRSIIYGITLVIEGSLVFSVKKISGEMRPNGQGTESFPSGHTANAFAGAEFMRREYKNVSPWYGIGGYVAAATTGFLRMYNNKHWVSDVIAGAGVGILSTDLAYYAYPVVKRIFFKNRAVSTMILPAYQNKVVSIGLVHTF